MKKILLMFVFFVSTVVIANAQNGDVYVINDLNDCDIAIDVVATCPNCSTYSSMMMTTVHPNGTWPGYKLYDAGGATPYFMGPDPSNDCPGQWTWAYADVVIFCGGIVHHVRVGNPNNPCTSEPNVKSIGVCSECFEGEVNVRFTTNHDYPGRVIITVGN